MDGLIRLLDTHMDDDLSLARLSALAAVSPCHLQRALTLRMGISPARRVRLLRLKRAAMQLAFFPARPITVIAFEAGFENAESLSRAFRQVFGQSPREFRRAPAWERWLPRFEFQRQEATVPMEVRIVDFPETLVAALEHRGSPHREYETARKFIVWRIANRLPPDRHRTYGVHYSEWGAGEDYRMDICVSIDRPVEPNDTGVVTKTLAGGRYAVARHVGPREFISAARYLHDVWLPKSGEVPREDPMLFHYVNVGPGVREQEMITDVYLPIR